MNNTLQKYVDSLNSDPKVTFKHGDLSDVLVKIHKNENVNIVTCGQCGDVVFHITEVTDDIKCPHCLFVSEPCHFPDFYQ